MPGERDAWGVLSLVTFFAQAKKVTRSTAGRVEALDFTKKCEELDSGLTSSAVESRRNDELREKQLDSGLRRNDEQGNANDARNTIPTQPSP